jgi:hypothetical protein
MRNFIGATVLVLFAVSLLIIVADVAWERNKEARCLELAEQARDYVLFEYSDYEAHLCGITK